MVSRISLKAYLKDEGIRRISMDKSEIADLYYVQQRILNLFKLPLDSPIDISWKDGDGDFIKVSTNDELIDAVNSRDGDVLKLYISRHQKDSADTQFSIAPQNSQLLLQNSSPSPSEASPDDTAPTARLSIHGPFKGWKGPPRWNRKWTQQPTRWYPWVYQKQRELSSHQSRHC